MRRPPIFPSRHDWSGDRLPRSRRRCRRGGDSPFCYALRSKSGFWHARPALGRSIRGVSRNTAACASRGCLFLLRPAGGNAGEGGSNSANQNTRLDSARTVCSADFATAGSPAGDFFPAFHKVTQCGDKHIRLLFDWDIQCSRKTGIKIPSSSGDFHEFSGPAQDGLHGVLARKAQLHQCEEIGTPGSIHEQGKEEAMSGSSGSSYLMFSRRTSSSSVTPMPAAGLPCFFTKAASAASHFPIYFR